MSTADVAEVQVRLKGLLWSLWVRLKERKQPSHEELIEYSELAIPEIVRQYPKYSLTHAEVTKFVASALTDLAKQPKAEVQTPEQLYSRYEKLVEQQASSLAGYAGNLLASYLDSALSAEAAQVEPASRADILRYIWSQLRPVFSALGPLVLSAALLYLSFFINQLLSSILAPDTLKFAKFLEYLLLTTFILALGFQFVELLSQLLQTFLKVYRMIQARRRPTVISISEKP